MSRAMEGKRAGNSSSEHPVHGTAMDSQERSASANLPCEEPSALDAHARFRGGRGSVTTSPTRPKNPGFRPKQSDRLQHAAVRDQRDAPDPEALAEGLHLTVVASAVLPTKTLIATGQPSAAHDPALAALAVPVAAEGGQRTAAALHAGRGDVAENENPFTPPWLD